MEQGSLKKATDLILDTIQNSDINELDKMELMMNLYIFLNNYDEAIKQRFDNRRNNDIKGSSRRI